MKYKTKIVPFNDGYIGYVYRGEELVFTSNKHKDATLVSRELSKYISAQPSATPEPQPNKPTVKMGYNLLDLVNSTNKNAVPAPLPPSALPQPPPPFFIPTPPSPPVKRRCCGRG